MTEGILTAAPGVGRMAAARTGSDELDRVRNALLPTRYMPGLDGLRAMAVLLVVASHAAPAHLVPGGFGVTLFFFISGYLLTGQMVDEYLRSGRIDFTGFYLRRILRLLPAATVYIVVSGLVFTAMGGRMTVFGWLSAIFYGANYYEIFIGYGSSVTVPGPSGPVPVPHPFSILWSLAIEEHFYMIWPAILVGLLSWRGWRGAAWALVAACVLALAWRFALHELCESPAPSSACGTMPENRLYAGTDTRLDSLAWGALAAVLVVQRETRWLLSAVRSRLIGVTALLLLLSTFAIRSDEFREVPRYTLQGLSLVILVLTVLSQNSWPRRLLEARPLVSIGKISYSLYLWHWLAGMCAVYVMSQNTLGRLLVYVGLTALLSAASWYGIERPMLRLRRWAGSRASSETIAPGTRGRKPELGAVTTPVTG